VSTAQAYRLDSASSTALRPATEADELKPATAHIASRVGAERLAYSYFATHKLPVVMARLAEVYGPYQYPDHLPAKWITSALLNEMITLPNHGQTGHDWLHVSDACAALDVLLHARKRDIEGEVFNVGSGHLRTDMEMAELIVNFADKPKELLEVKAEAATEGMAIDTTKLERLGWTIRKDFHQGIAETINWYQGHKDWWEKLRQPSPEMALKLPSLEDDLS
jgi:dTDP-glucose 4,6-dehydratase